MAQEMNTYVQNVSDWLTSQRLDLTPGNSSVTLFILWMRKVNNVIDILIDGVQISMNKNSKILGVTFYS